jgi:hypothetical protein
MPLHPISDKAEVSVDFPDKGLYRQLYEAFAVRCLCR